jgi:hypothetical protein
VQATLYEILEQCTRELQDAAHLRPVPTFTFPADIPAGVDPGPLRVRCTRSRTVCSWRHGVFVAREVVMQGPSPQEPMARCVLRSEELRELVAPQDTYAFDLMVHVGRETLLECQRLADVSAKLAKRPGFPALRDQTLWRLEQKFLVYLGVFHRACLPTLRRYFERHGGYVLIADSTCEDGPPALLVALEPTSGIVLGSWKIASENKADVRQCLEEIRTALGSPLYILIDLSQALREGLAEAFPHVPQKKCHFHFLSDVGKDLCDPPQKKLSQAHRPHHLQRSLRTLRVDLRRRLLQRSMQRDESPGLYDFLKGTASEAADPRLLQQQILLSIHDWIQDFRHDGHREGYPFDPFFLYLHRRLAAAKEALDHLIAQADAKPNDLVALRNLHQRLGNYLGDAKVQEAVQEFEEAYRYLQRLRHALHLCAPQRASAPRSERHDLSPAQAKPIESSIDSFVQELRKEQPSAAAHGQRCIRIILDHLDQYAEELKPFALADEPPSHLVHRTTNAVEQFFRLVKRLRRRVHGRRSLRLDLVHLPQELPLVLNLQNDTYVELTLGSLDALPRAFSHHAQEAKQALKARRQESEAGPTGVPKRVLRAPGYLDALPAVIPLAVSR